LEEKIKKREIDATTKSLKNGIKTGDLHVRKHPPRSNIKGAKDF